MKGVENTMENLLSRRSTKKYLPDSVPEELIDAVINAGLHAASGMNNQDAIVIAVTDPETRNKISAANAKIIGHEDMDPFYGAPVILAVLGKVGGPTHLENGCLVLGNMMTAAHALGLGNCWIHRAKQTFDMPEWKEWLKSIGVEGEWEGVGHLALGYADLGESGEFPAALPRKEGRVFKV